MAMMVMIISHLVTMRGKVKGLGKIAISNDMSIFNVLLVESLNFNLLSVAQLCDLGFKCIFRVDGVEIISVDAKRYSSGLLVTCVILILCWLCGTLLRVWRVMLISMGTSK